jgi:hypothetical protein
MQETTIDVMEAVTQTNEVPEAMTPTSLLDLPVARLQIVQSSEVIKADWLDRPMLEPTLAQNADGLWVLSVRRQGEHSKFEVPFIGSEILHADAELGLVVVLVGYHGSSTEKYGRLGYMTQKGQFYRYYQQQSDGTWTRAEWRNFNDDLRQLIIDLPRPEWGRVPGKLKTERKPPTKSVKMTTYKVVRLIDGRYFSLYDPEVEYKLGEKMKQPARKNHSGGFFSYPTLKQGEDYLTHCLVSMPFHEEVVTPQLALLEVEAWGKSIDYGHKWCSTYLLPLRVLEVRDLAN